MQTLFGSYDSGEAELITEKGIRTFYNLLHFIKTQLYKDVIKWQTENNYVIFKTISLST